MKLISILLFFFLMEMYSASQFAKIQLAPREPNSRRTDPTEAPPHHIKPRQASVDDYIFISKNPFQKITLKFDTGSRDMWVFSDRYDTCDPNYNVVKTKHHRYNYSISPTYGIRGEPQPQFMTHLDEFVFGLQALDAILIVGYEVNRTFIEVTKASKYLTDWEHDGVMGLQYDPAIMNTYGTTVGVICNQWNQNRVFSFTYPKNISLGPRIEFCGDDPRWFNGNTRRVFKESEPGNWLISVQYVIFGDNVIRWNTQLLIRTALQGVHVPKKDISKLFGEIQYLFPEIGIGSQFDCSHVPRLPYLDFLIGDIHIGLSGDYYSRKVYNETSGTRCKLDFEESSYDYWSVGDNFLRKYYVTFNMDRNQIEVLDSIGS